MKINTMSTLLGTAFMPLWAPADEGGSGGGTDGTDVSETGNDTSGDEGKTQTTETALGGDQPDDKSDGGTALGDGAEDDNAGKSEDGDDENAEGNQVPDDGVYDFGDMPEGIEIDDERRDAWSKQFKELGLTRAQAKGLAQMRAAEAVAEVQSNTQRIEAQQTEHLAAAKADKDIGGDNWDESVRLANLGMKALGGDGIKGLILSTGNGNNPEMIRELRRIGELVKDDNFEAGSSREAPVSTESKWYGETTPDTKKG